MVPNNPAGQSTVLQIVFFGGLPKAKKLSATEFTSCQKKISVAKSICQLPKLDHLATNLQH